MERNANFPHKNKLKNKRNIFIVDEILTSSKSRGVHMLKIKTNEMSFLTIIQMVLLFNEE